MKDNNSKINRRHFVKSGTLAAAGITIVPRNVVAGLGYKAPSDKLNIAGIGVGGRGYGNLRELESENIVALCDVDWNYSQRVFEHFPKVKIPEQTEPPFRGKLNQMLKDGFAVQI